MVWWIVLPSTYLVVITYAYLVRWAAGYLVDEDKKNVAGFSFVLGMAGMANGPVMGRLDGLLMMSVYLGCLLGLGTVWYLFFKRAKVNG